MRAHEASTTPKPPPSPTPTLTHISRSDLNIDLNPNPDPPTPTTPNPPQAVAHYSRQALRQAYVLLGTLDVLGNPMGIVVNISAGLRDFIYEPARGLNEGNLWRFSVGLYRGSRSLVGRVLASTLDSIQSLASSLHAGILPLVLVIGKDDSVLAVGAGGSFQGLKQGLKALLWEPIRGAQLGGITGLQVGVARGIVTLVLKPLLGVLEDTLEICRLGASQLSPHLSRTGRQSRVRLPRLFRSPHAPLQVYSEVGLGGGDGLELGLGLGSKL